MNIKWVQSRSSKKKEKNKEQSFLRWYDYRGSTEMQEEDMLKMDDIYKAEMTGLKAKSLLV